MKIEYKNTKIFTEKELQRLFLSVKWESGNYLDKLVRAMQNSTYVISAWDGNKRIGLIRALGDELMKRILRYFENLLYVKIMPSDPKTITFYERYGFQQYDNYSAMVLKNM